MIVKNPYNGAELGQVNEPSDRDIAKALESATAAAKTWKNSSSFDRSQLLQNVASKLQTQRSDFAKLISEEAGKPVKFAEIEVDRAIGVLQWAASEALRFGGETLRLDTTKSGRSGFGIINRFPRGIILGITPFNFPLNLLVHKVAPALASGNVIVIKPSPATPLTALKFASLFEQDTAYHHVVTILAANDSQTANLTKAPEIAMVSFTGSAKIGWLIRGQAPQKPVTLELGGNAWCLIAEDVSPKEIPAIAKRVANAAFGYAGQSCISVQNVAVAATHWSLFRDALAAATIESSYGDPASAEVLCGPLINAAAKSRIENELKNTKTAKMVQSRKIIGDYPSSQLVPPTFVDSPERTSSLVREEIFGPVVTATAYHRFSEALTMVNESRYGLQAGLYSNDLASIELAYKELEVGGLIVNDVPTTRYDHQPYGGIKDSGFGREGVAIAMEEMTEPKFLALSSVRNQ